MPANIDVASRHFPRRRSVMMIRQAERNVVIAQQVQDRWLIPARVAELEDVLPLGRQQLEERREPLAVRLKASRKLKQHRPQLVAEYPQARLHQFQTVLASRREPLPMRDEFGRFPGEDKAGRRLLAPSADRLQRGRAIERAVDLRGS